MSETLQIHHISLGRFEGRIPVWILFNRSLVKEKDIISMIEPSLGLSCHGLIYRLVLQNSELLLQYVVRQAMLGL